MRWQPYVPVAQRKARGLAEAKRLIGGGKSMQPVQIQGRTIAKSFWGAAWCKHFESFSDFANRLPRGRTYARNGSIMHLEIASGKITAMVAGSELYRIKIGVDKMSPRAWERLCRQCDTSVTSTIDLLRGKLPRPILDTLTDPDNDLFPGDDEIRLSCDCPDWADLCKHLAAVLYGVGHRLDDSPELLFLLRGVDPNDLIGQSLREATDAEATLPGAKRLDVDAGLQDIFGIELINDPAPTRSSGATPGTKKRTKKKSAKKKTAKKTATAKKISAGKKSRRKKASTKTSAKRKSR